MSPSSREEKVESINKVSPCFCLAKWTQVTIDLVHGTNHSCHHPKRHVIPLEELEKNPSALHNTQYKKEVRQQMLEGVRPKECHYCWNIEDTPGAHYSDRIVKSLDPWSFPYKEEVLKCGATGDYAPHYVEVMFDSACNFACSYCLADISSSIMKEMKTFGPYPVSNNTHRMPDPDWKKSFKKDENPYISAFWKWLPEIWEGLHVFRITGGEPLLSKHTYRLLEYCLENPQPQLTVAINSNLCVDKDRLERLKNVLGSIQKKKTLKGFEIYASVDTLGEQAEYIRQGMDYAQFLHNLQDFLESGLCERIILMGTFNLLSLPRFDDFLKEVISLKEKFPSLVLDLSYLKEPEYLKANLAPAPIKSSLKKSLNLMKSSGVFSPHEVNKLERIYHWIQVEPPKEDLSLGRADFYSFIVEYDKRYEGSFIQTFPELKEFFIECKKEKFLRGKMP